MPEESVIYGTLQETARRVAQGQISPRELVASILERIERLNPELGAFIAVNPRALQEAAQAEKSSGGKSEDRPLHGVPISVKDLFLTRNLPTTAGSRIFGRGLTSRTDAEAVRRLLRAGAILIGKTNLHEVAFGITNENDHFGPARNPWDRTRMAGGSSGGSAVALSAGLGYASLGTDTRGSIRIPSACCGTTGLKPSRGLVSQKGLLPLSPTLDHAGPIARSVEDCALLLGILTTPRRRQDYETALQLSAGSMRVGVCDYYWQDLDPEVESSLQEAVRVLQREGLQFVPVSMKGLQDGLHASATIALAEAAALHEPHLRERPSDYGPAVRSRLEGGLSIRAVELVRALETRRRLEEEFQQLFRQVDVLLGGALPVPAPPLGTRELGQGEKRVSIVEAFVRLNAPQNVAGLPSLCLPCGFTSSGLPVGMQVVAARRSEAKLFCLGAHYQRLTDWHRRHPPL